NLLGDAYVAVDAVVEEEEIAEEEAVVEEIVEDVVEEEVVVEDNGLDITNDPFLAPVRKVTKANGEKIIIAGIGGADLTFLAPVIK
ncbi:MAG: hypothetical protein J6D10_06345, partial [Clostridia bacterium]|nr:hypothetical protein [Clostridia bacterium]